MSNKISRKYHFKSYGHAYTAWITAGMDVDALCRLEGFPELPNLPYPYYSLPAIIIINDANPDERYDIREYGDGISVDGYVNFEAELHQISTIDFEEQYGYLTFYLCDNVDADIEEYENEDDWYAGTYDIPCDKRLAAFIINRCGCIWEAVDSRFEKNNEFMDKFFHIKDFIIED